MERVFWDNRKDPLFWKRYSKSLLEFRGGEYLCMRAFTKGLKNNFDVEIAGVIWPIKSGGWRTCFAIPNEDEFNIWLKKNEIQNKLAITDKSSHHWMYHQEENSKRKEKGVCSFSKEFIALRIPRLYEKHFGKRSCYICLVNPSICTPPTEGIHEFELDCLSNIVDVWGWGVNYHRDVFSKTCSLLMRGNINSSNRRPFENTIKNCLDCIYRMMSIREVFQLVDLQEVEEEEKDKVIKGKEYRQINVKLKDKVDETLIDYFWGLAKNETKEWHHCTPPLWPPCLGKVAYPGKSKLLEILELWIENSNVKKLKQRRDKNFYKQNIDCLEIIKGQTEKELSQEESHDVDNPEENHIILLRGYLFNFFFNKAINNNTFRANFWFSKAPSDEDLSKAFFYLTKLSQYLLADFTIDSQTILGMIWLISEYVHHNLGLPGRVDFAAHLLQASRGEPALHSLRHYYRDHFFHALEVCFLGHFLLELEIEDGKRLWEKVSGEMGFTEDGHKKVLRFWYLAALLHDVGYGIDALKGVRDLLNFFQNAQPLKELREDLEKVVDKLSTELSVEGFVGYEASDKPGEDHGVIAARHLEGLLKIIAKDDPNVKPEEYEPSIRAIAMHNSRNHTVNFDDEPLAFLLILCDTIQEWNRMQFNFATAPVEILTKLEGYGVREEDLMGPLLQVKMNAEPLMRASGEIDYFRISGKDGKKIHFTLEYDEGIQKNAGVFNLWIDASCNLQRLDFGDLNIEIDVEYVTPWYRGEDGTLEQQFYRLRDAARDTHMGFLADWFPEKVNKEKTGVTNEAVEYIAEEAKNGLSKKERLILHLRELAKKRRITKDIEVFRDRLKEWKQYNEDRDFSGDYAEIIPG